MLDLLPTQNHKVKLLNMELTKEEMKKVIKWLEDYHVLSDYKPEDFPDDIDCLPTIVHKFKTYLEGGENNG